MRANVTITSAVDYIHAHRNTEDIFVYIKLKNQSSFSINASKNTLLAMTEGIKTALEWLEMQEAEAEAKIHGEMLKNIAKYSAPVAKGSTLEVGV